MMGDFSDLPTNITFRIKCNLQFPVYTLSPTIIHSSSNASVCPYFYHLLLLHSPLSLNGFQPWDLPETHLTKTYPHMTKNHYSINPQIGNSTPRIHAFQIMIICIPLPHDGLYTLFNIYFVQCA